MKKRRRRPGKVKTAFTTVLRPCHSCGIPFTPGEKFTGKYGHLYHPQCWSSLLKGGDS